MGGKFHSSPTCVLLGERRRGGHDSPAACNVYVFLYAVHQKLVWRHTAQVPECDCHWRQCSAVRMHLGPSDKFHRISKNTRFMACWKSTSFEKWFACCTLVIWHSGIAARLWLKDVQLCTLLKFPLDSIKYTVIPIKSHNPNLIPIWYDSPDQILPNK